MTRYFLVTLMLATPVFAKSKPHVQVQGNCEIKVIPDRGTITFNAENQSKDQKVAVAATLNQINKLKEEIDSLKLKDVELKNTNYSVYPVKEYEKERYVDKGIRATLTLEVTTSEIDRIGETMIKASKVGILNVGSLKTFLSLEKSQKEYLKCLDIAAVDARQKAHQLGKKLDFEVGEVIALNEVPNLGRNEEPQASMMKTWGAMDAAAAPKIETGTQTYTTNIQVTFKIK